MVLSMTSFFDLKNYFSEEKFDRVIIVSEAEPKKTIKTPTGGYDTTTSAGGVSVALEPVARASNAIYIGRAREIIEKEVLDKNDKLVIPHRDGNYTLKRLFFDERTVDGYYSGFSNQTLWPLCHVSFEKPQFEASWYEDYKTVNKAFAEAIQAEIKGRTLVWINDYQLSLVPLFLGAQKETTVGMFWHIPWPTWEVFRILPWKKDILWSLLSTDFLAFHRNYQAQNFLRTVDQELAVRVEHETKRVFFNDHITTVTHLPMGIDVEVIEDELEQSSENTFLGKIIRSSLGIEEKTHPLDSYFAKYKVIIGVDRLDYTKGLPKRLEAIEMFFETYPEWIGKAIYLGIIAPSRESISSYQEVKRMVDELEKRINKRFGVKGWQPLHLLHASYQREEVLYLYRKAHVCLVTPLDDGMNLVSKEYIVASSKSADPGMLVLSQFAGSAIDLTEALLVNPYNKQEVSESIQRALAMPKQEKIERLTYMIETLRERNMYEWAINFIKGTSIAGRHKRKSPFSR